MSIEKTQDCLERTEANLKQRLSDYKSVMPVKGWNWATLLEIYWEWMNYLVKENLKGRSDLIERWKKFLLERNTDAIADLLMGFFEAKRRYGRDIERGEDKWDWFALCKNYCKRNGWNDDENLLHSFFSSYSWAERRIYRKIEKGKVLSDTSKSISQIMNLTKAEMIQKEEEKKRKADEKLKKAEEKEKRAEEREKRKEENAKRKAEKKAKKTNIDGAKTDNSDVIESSDWDEEDKEVDPDYPKAPEWWRDPVDLRVSWPHFEQDTDNWNNVNWSGEVKNKWPKMGKDGQYLIDFPEDE